MNGRWYLTNKKLLLRQAIAAWVVLFISVLMFTGLALLLSQVIQSRELIIILTLALVFPLIVIVHILLKRSDYYIKKPIKVPIVDTSVLLNLQSQNRQSTHSTQSTQSTSGKILLPQYRVVLVKLSNYIELHIEGLPQFAMSPELESKVALVLIQHGIPTTGMISAGILGGIRTATLHIAGEYYELKYSIKILRMVKALEIYNEAIRWIKFQKASNRVDAVMADQAVEYLRQAFRRELGE